MNDLNLRIAALKLCAHPKRLSEMRGALVPIPIKWQNSNCNYVKQFAAASSCTEQIAVAKQLFNEPEAFAFLADLLLASPLKHSVRGTLTKLFSNYETNKRANKTHTKEALESVLCDAIGQLAESVKSPDVSLDLLNDVIVSIGGCLHNFDYGRNALAQHIYEFIPVLPKALERYWSSISEAGEDVSPTRRNEFYLFIQSLLRFHVNFLVDFKLLLKPEMCQELRFINATAQLVARHVETPWDVRSVAGLAIGHNARFFNEFHDYLIDCKNMKAEYLPIKAAALLLFQKTDYEQHIGMALDILKQMYDQVKASNNVTNLLVYMSKHLYTYSKSLPGIKLKDRALVIYNVILATLMRFAMEYISINVESIRHMTANLLGQVIQLCKANNQYNIINQIYATVERQSLPLNAACLVLQQLVDNLGTTSVFHNCPKICGTIFSGYLGVEDNVNTLYKCMMTAAYKEESFENWFNTWCLNLMNQAYTVVDRLPIIERLIKVAVQLDHTVLPLVLKQRSVPFSTKLAAMLEGRANGHHREVKTLMLDFTDQINDSIVGVNDNSRLMALGFVVETPKLSEPYTQFELDAILSYVEYNANSPNAHLRQIGRGILQKAIKRFDLNLGQQLKENSELSDEHMLIKFINELMYILMSNLFPTANYGRRWLSMHLLKDCIEVMERHRQSWIPKLPSHTMLYLLHCLGDSYEHNKSMAADLLKCIQLPTILKPSEMLELLVSLRPPDSLTGAYQLQVYCQSMYRGMAVPQVTDALPETEPRYYAVLQWLLHELRKGIEVAQLDLTQAATTNPLYGLLAASRHLLQLLVLHKLAEEPLWRDYIRELVSTCLQISGLMLPVVGSDSPEGFVPDSPMQQLEELMEVNKVKEEKQTVQPKQEEQAKEDDETSNSDTDSEEENKPSIIPQLVLLCAWRSMKDVCLILGELVEQAPLQKELPVNYLINNEQLAEIGEHFLLLLAEIKHRGAFEQAYVGFTQLCRRFWSSNEPPLNQLPMIWLNETLQLIMCPGVVTSIPGKSICATRRSAGVPYILQALICTELKLGTHKTFSRSMTLLLQVCESREEGSAAAVSRSHALNIMRALFRCSELSELVGEFIGRGVQCALDSLDAPDWSERNGGTLLLSALIIRIFGVERPRNDDGQLHVRNRMTGRIFFTRYPKLYDYIHASLRRAALDKQLGVSSSGQALHMEAMLQLLSRLYPSSLEGTENALNLGNFVPFLQKIGCGHDHVTRQRASQVLANFMTPELAEKSTSRILLRLKMMNFGHQEGTPYTNDLNGLHGYLLQLLELYRQLSWQKSELISSIVRVVSITSLKCFDLDIYVFQTSLTVLTAIMLDVNSKNRLSADDISALEVLVTIDQTMLLKYCEEYAVSPIFYYIFALHLQRIKVETKEILEHMLALLVRRDYVPAIIQQLIVDLWLRILFPLANNASKTRGLVDCFEAKNYYFDPTVNTYCKALGSKRHQLVAHFLRECEEAIVYIHNLADRIAQEPKKHPRFGVAVYTLLALLGRLEVTLPELLKRRDCGIEPGLVICLTRVVAKQGMGKLEHQEHWMTLMNYALEMSAPAQGPYLRYKAAQLVGHMSADLCKIIESNNVKLIGKYMRIVLQLLVDESELVRNHMAEMIASCMDHYVEMKQPPIMLIGVTMMPMSAEIFFLQHLLNNLRHYAENGSFLIELFTLIIEPFVSSELLDNRAGIDAAETTIAEVVDMVFDKQDTNLYCEGLRVASMVAKYFRNTFGNNKELISALNALQKWTLYNGFRDELVPTVNRH